MDDTATVLTSALCGLAGSAGGDAAGESFAARADPAIGSLIGLLQAGVAAFGGVSKGLVATGRNYAIAEGDSTAGTSGVVESFSDPGVIDAVSYPSPASMAGGHAGGANRFLARYWPQGDPGRLRGAAAAFRSAGFSLEALGGDAQRVVDGLLESSSSPALDSFTGVWTGMWRSGGGSMGRAVDACATLAKACSQFADRIDRAHHDLEVAPAAVGVVTAAGVLFTVFTVGLSDVVAAELDTAIATEATAIAIEFAVDVAAEVETAIDVELVPLLRAAASGLPDIEVVTAESTQVESELIGSRALARVGAGPGDPDVPISGGGGGSGGGAVDAPPEPAPQPAPGGGGAKPPGKPPIPIPAPIGDGDGQEDRSHDHYDPDDLGYDPAVGQFRPQEERIATEVEAARGIRLQRLPAEQAGDWVDSATGETYDAVGPVPSRFFDDQWSNLTRQISRHLFEPGKAVDFVPLDVSGLSPEQAGRLIAWVARFGDRVIIVGG